RYSYIPEPNSIYRGIRKLTPGHVASIRCCGTPAEPVLRCYWSAREAALRGLKNPFRGSDREAIETLGELLASSVKLRMACDVPCGAYLSGGYDSSTVVALMRQAGGGPVKTFTLGFEEADEIPFARKVARHLE